MFNYKLYTDLELLPIWNWSKCVKENDVRYLLRLDDYNKLPSINKFAHRDLIRIYSKLFNQFDIKQNQIIKAKKKVLIRIIDIILDIVRTSKDVEKIRKASTILRALMIDSTHDEFIWNVDFVETADQKQLLTQLAIDVKKYNEKVKKQGERKQQTLSEQIARISSGLGVNIDAKTCSVNQFMAFSKEYATKVNLTNRKVNLYGQQD